MHDSDVPFMTTSVQIGSTAPLLLFDGNIFMYVSICIHVYGVSIVEVEPLLQSIISTNTYLSVFSL